jgi:hypothetical protein
MVKKCLFELDEVAFIADINPTDLPTPVQDLLVGIRAQTTAAASIAGTTVLNTISLLRVFVGGNLLQEITGEEILAYNVLALNNIPRKINSGAVATNPAVLQGLKLPLQIPAGKKAQIQVVYASQTNVGSGVLAVHIQQLDKLGGPMQGMLRKPITPTQTGAFARAIDISVAGAKIAGLLCYSTTIPVTTAITTSLHKLRLIVAGALHSEYSWMNMGAGNLLTGGDADIDGAIDNYRWLPFEEPLPADDVKVDIYADDTNSVRIIPLYQYP